MTCRECRTAEADVGMLYYLTGAAGTGGRIKVAPEDFIVSEVSNRPEEDKNGRFTIATVKARNWETNRMVRLLSREMGISRERIGFAGTKDKRAVTTQLMSVLGGPELLERIDLKDLEISDVYRARHGLRIGDLIGNNFEIRVTGCTMPDADIPGTVESVASEIKKTGGFPNYYGVQRFGIVRPITHLVGEKLVRGDIEGAVKCYVCAPAVNASKDDSAVAMREKLKATDDWAPLVDEIPEAMSFEKTMVQHVVQHPGDWTGAIAEMPTNLQMMFVHAYQSYLFNIMLSRRIEAGLPLNRPVEGDIVVPLDSDGIPLHEQTVKATAKNIDLVERQVKLKKAFVTGCLFGSKSEFADGQMGEIERKVVEEQKLEPRDFEIPGLPHCSSEGGRRELLCPVKDLSWDVSGNTYTVKFFLPKGNYATCLMREFMKSEITDY
ncbi:MAG: tRNA pseudouridine(13) synthase TruD [Methanomethylophilus sp.]|jgi:tRNA pseudouridine13 synthase